MSTQPQRKVPSPADINRQQGFEPPRSKVEATSSAVVAKAAAPATGTKATVPATTVQAPPPALPDTRTPEQAFFDEGSVQPAPELSEDEDDVADGDEGVTAPDHPGKYKPAGLPSVPDMITATLRAAGPGGLQTKQIAEFIRQKWWPEITGGRIACIAWSMKRRGLVEKRGQRYRIKPNGYASEAGGALGNGAAR